MTCADSTALPDSPGTLEANARHHLDIARACLSELEGAADDGSQNRASRAFWQHMNMAWQFIQRSELAVITGEFVDPV